MAIKKFKIKGFKNKRITKHEEDDPPMIFFEKNNVREEKPDVYTDRKEDYPPETNNNIILKEIFDWAKHIIIAVMLGLLLVVFVVQRNEVIGSSMEPNLFGDDQLLVQKISRLFSGGITHEDIITINAEGFSGHAGDKNIIKRVIGLPGDRIEIKNDKVFRNGDRIAEQYLADGTITNERDSRYSYIVLGESQYYVLGDNRSVSLDSRTFGPIDKNRIIGEVLIRFYPLDSFGKP